MKKYSHKKAYEIVENIEIKNNVETIKINNTQIWPLIKFSLFRTLTGVENESTSKLSTLKNYIQNYLVSNIVKSYINVKKKSNFKTAIFSFPDARRKINDEYFDILFDLDKKFKNSLFFEWNGPSKHIKKSHNSKKILFLDLISLKVDIKTIIRFPFFNKKIKLNTKYINKEKINLIFKIQYLQFECYKKEIEKILNKHNKIEKIYIKTSYTPRHQALISVAKKRNIKVIELQHGIISDSHPGYIYKKKMDSTLFPNNILVYGPKTKEILSLNSELYSINQIGFHKQLRNLKKIYGQSKNKIKQKINPENKKVILITSQWLKKEKIRNILTELTKKLPQEYLILLKTHPLEKKPQEYYSKLLGYKNFKLIENKEISVYELFEISHIHTSYFSTCVFESMYWKIPNILFLDEDSRSNLDAIDKSSIYFVKNSKEYIKKLAEVEKNYEEVKAKVKKESKKFYI